MVDLLGKDGQRYCAEICASFCSQSHPHFWPNRVYDDEETLGLFSSASGNRVDWRERGLVEADGWIQQKPDGNFLSKLEVSKCHMWQQIVSPVVLPGARRS